MKLLDQAFDKMVEMAKPVQQLAEGLKLCAQQMEKLATNLATIAHNQAVHHQMIQQMWGVQQNIFKKLHENALDMSMPDIDKPQTDAEKLEDVKKKASQKPN